MKEKGGLIPPLLIRMEKSLFIKKEGATPKYKVLDFLITAQDFDYSLKDIAKHAGISYPCMKQLKKRLIMGKWVIFTRKVGKAQMYKLNVKNKKVQKFIDFYWSAVNEEVDQELKSGETQAKVSPISGAIAAPVSARQV